MEYMKVSKAAEKWGISTRRVRVLCAEGKIPGVIRKGNLYMIPETAQKPLDGRRTRAGVLAEIEQKRERLDAMRPLTPGEVKRLQEEFMVEFTYNSNAIEGNTLTLKETAMVLEGMTIDQKPLKDHLEAVGHRDAFLYIQDIAKQDVPLSEFVIKNIHSLVLMNQPEDKGVFRKIPICGAKCMTKNQILIAFSSKRNCSMPIYKMPLSSCHGMIASFTTTIFLNESETRVSEAISCLRFSPSATESADWI